RTHASTDHGPDGKSAKYANLAKAAAKLPIPENVQLKDRSQFKLIGKPFPRLDGQPKCDGSQKFGLDLDLPGMKIALVAHPPVFGGRVKSFDDKAARAVQGVADVFEIPLPRGSGVAVVAERFWTAKRARDQLKIEWDLSQVARADTAQLTAQYKQLAQTPGNV